MTKELFAALKNQPEQHAVRTSMCVRMNVNIHDIYIHDIYIHDANIHDINININNQQYAAGLKC